MSERPIPKNASRRTFVGTDGEYTVIIVPVARRGSYTEGLVYLERGTWPSDATLLAIVDMGDPGATGANFGGTVTPHNGKFTRLEATPDPDISDLPCRHVFVNTD